MSTSPAFSRSTIRSLVRSAYQIQKLRIQTGLRIVANFKVKLGQEPGEKETELGTEAKKLLKDLRESANRITDTLAAKPLRKVSLFVGDGLITDYAEYTLIESYNFMLKREEEVFGQFDKIIATHPMYDWLKSVRGCGPAMSAVLLAEIDIHRTETVGQLWAYCGLDVVKVPREVNGETVLMGEGRSRRREHLVQRMYINAKGEEDVRDSITYNDFLKTKVRGVLADCLMMGDGYFKQVYMDYKFRLQNDPRHASKTPAHLNNMAKRYMVKIFLQYFFLEWRKLEGYEPTKPYHESKLGMVHHGPRFTGDTPRKRSEVTPSKTRRQEAATA